MHRSVKVQESSPGTFLLSIYDDNGLPIATKPMTRYALRDLSTQIEDLLDRSGPDTVRTCEVSK